MSATINEIISNISYFKTNDNANIAYTVVGDINNNNNNIVLCFNPAGHNIYGWSHCASILNNAGITSDQLFLKMKDDDWDNVISTNLTGTYNLTKIFIRNMIKNKNGRIINISSVAGLMGNPGQVNYSSSKSALTFSFCTTSEISFRSVANTYDLR